MMRWNAHSALPFHVISDRGFGIQSILSSCLVRQWFINKKMFLVLHSQKLKQKQVILSTMPGSFLFMFVMPGLSHVGLIARVPAQ
jgi:hypothetical protein